MLTYAVWPAQLVPLEYLGCWQHAYLDCKTGCVFCTAPSASNEAYELGPVAASLEVYLERWLRGELLP